MEQQGVWVTASYPKQDITKSFMVTSLRFIERKASYTIFECSDGSLVNIFADQINVLKLVKSNPYGLFAVGFLNKGSKYCAYKVDFQGKQISVPTVSRLLSIVQGDEQSYNWNKVKGILIGE